MIPISKKYQKSNALTLERFDRSMGAPILLGILFFFILCLGAADSIKMTVMVVAVFTLFIIAARFKILRERIHWPFIALTLVVLMDGISTFYAVSGKFALREFLKVFLAYLLAVILLATSPKKEETVGKRIATILAVCTAVGSLVSIDLISTRWISGAVTWVLGHFTEAYESVEGASWTRITSYFTNSNVFAGFSGIGALLSLGLADFETERKRRMVFLVSLFLNTLAFILAVSLGAMFFLAISLIVFIMTKPEAQRKGLLVLVLEGLVLAGVAAALIYRTSFGNWNGVQPIPLLCVLFGAVVFYLSDVFLNNRINPEFKTRRATRIIIICSILVLAAGYMLLAWNTTGGITISPEERLRRATYPEPGEYTLDLQTDGTALHVVIYSQTREQVSMHTETSLYNGDAYTAAFTVPEDSVIVYFDFMSWYGIHIDSASFGGYEIPLNYKLLPGFLASRLQGLRYNSNSAERTVYFNDGFKLFQRSPVIGLGIGAFENGIKSVQSFYYETKYAHNHYFQTMLETGIIGLILFLFLLVSSAVAIWKSRKEQPFAPMLGAALVFMAGQAIHDIVFSAYAYLPIAYGTFAMINLCCGQEIKKPKLTNTFKTVAIVVSSVCIVVYCGFLAGNLMAKRNMEKNATMQTLVQSVKLDRFEWADYALAYVTNAMGDNVNPYVRQQADEYAERLAEVNSNTIPIYLAEYYFQSDRSEQGIDMLRKYVDYVSSDQSAWRNAFAVLRTYDDGSETFQSGAVRLADMLETWNNENLGTITLDDETNAYIAVCRQ